MGQLLVLINVIASNRHTINDIPLVHSSLDTKQLFFKFNMNCFKHCGLSQALQKFYYFEEFCCLVIDCITYQNFAYPFIVTHKMFDCGF